MPLRPVVHTIDHLSSIFQLAAPQQQLKRNFCLFADLQIDRLAIHTFNVDASITLDEECFAIVLRLLNALEDVGPRFV
jgi:hypothetical protein